jgi:hypothetical protein
MSPLSARDGLIACFGRHIGDLCTNTVPQIVRGSGLNLQFVLSDWLTEDQLSKAALFWVQDASTQLEDVQIAMKAGIPLLVPEESEVLRQVCLEGNCGLFYRSHDEAIASVIYLFQHPLTRAALGSNARRHSRPDRLSRGKAMAAGR